MLIMNENQLSEEQKKKIAEIKKEWAEEAKKISEPEIDFVGFSNLANKPYADLTKKYTQLIHEVVVEAS